jgi:CRISPR-associated protein Cas1
LDHQQITISQALMAKLLENNIALITCDNTHHPVGLMMNLEGHSEQSARFKSQIEASVPLKKQLWQHTVKSKIENQAALLKHQKKDASNMNYWANSVLSGDTQNHEGRAAAYYWKTLFTDIPDFLRDREGQYPNNLLNYGYAILRASTARAIVGSGLLPTLGIYHRNQYNAYCLADDLMEPYRPFVDALVLDIMANHSNAKPEKLNTETKRELLTLTTLDVMMDGRKSPLMIALSRTSASLVKCFEGELRKILYPEWVI